MQPDVFVIENVKGLLLSANGWFKDEIVKAVKKLGYTIEFDILNAGRFWSATVKRKSYFYLF